MDDLSEEQAGLVSVLDLRSEIEKYKPEMGLEFLGLDKAVEKFFNFAVKVSMRICVRVHTHV